MLTRRSLLKSGVGAVAGLVAVALVGKREPRVGARCSMVMVFEDGSRSQPIYGHYDFIAGSPISPGNLPTHELT